MKILVTGGAGFIGSHVVDAYLSLGHQVLVIDSLSSGFRDNVNAAAELVVADIRSEAAARAVELFAPDVVNLHAAQIDVRRSVVEPILDAEVNLIGCLKMVEAARRVKQLKRVIYAASGGSMYGDAAPLPTPETASIAAQSPYAVSKASFELYLACLRGTADLHYIALRYANVYGPRQNAHGEAGVVSIFCERLLAGQQCVIYGDGGQTRDFVYVDDVVRANVKALGTSFCGGVNVGSGLETSVNQLFERIAQSLGVTVKPLYQAPRLGEQRRSVLEVGLAKQVLDFSAAHRVEDGLPRTVAWYRSRTF